MVEEKGCYRSDTGWWDPQVGLQKANKWAGDK